MKKEKLITIKEASELMNVCHNTVRNYIDAGRLQSVKENVTKVYYDEVIELMRFSVADNIFGDIVLEAGESLRPLDGFRNVRGSGYNPLKYKTSQRYMVSNYGRVFNLERNSEKSQQIVDHDYLQVKLAQFGNKSYAMVHRLVAFIWCDNAKCKDTVHHIDGNKQNNRADNLVWATLKEQADAHKLLESAKATNDFTEYNKYIAELQADNRCSEPYFCVLEYADKSAFGFLYITEKAYKDLQNKKYDVEHIPISEIKGEFFSVNDFLSRKQAVNEQ